MSFNRSNGWDKHFTMQKVFPKIPLENISTELIAKIFGKKGKNYWHFFYGYEKDLVKYLSYIFDIIYL